MRHQRPCLTAIRKNSGNSAAVAHPPSFPGDGDAADVTAFGESQPARQNGFLESRRSVAAKSKAFY